VSRKLTGAYLEGRCRLAGITGGWHLKDREIERRLAGTPGATRRHSPTPTPPAAHSTYHPASALTSTCHPRGTAICLFIPVRAVLSGEKPPTGKLERRSGDWHPSAGPKGNRAGTAAERRLADGAVAPERRGAAGQHVAQQLNTYRTTARREHLAQGPGDDGSGDDGSRDGWRRAWARGLGPGRPGPGEDGSRGGSHRAWPQAGRGTRAGGWRRGLTARGRGRLAEGGGAGAGD
jgi:hypothetical protein